ncbi:DoxX family protein [Archangium minus]|uniref:DoxX family protein n=1 Tax=Archangium minus TaxID=83450 RepID=A0ABY9WXJ2_9BACT|nr:DoxX family protein [Archangium minus]
MSRIESVQSSPAARDVGPTVLRVALGAVFLAHAGAKAFIFTFAGTAQFFEAHGFPGWTAWPVFLAELLGGLALVAGFRTRWVALGLVPVMLGALKPHLANGWMFTNSGGGWEYVAFLLLALVAQALLGSGAYALDERANSLTRSTPLPAGGVRGGLARRGALSRTPTRG